MYFKRYNFVKKNRQINTLPYKNLTMTTNFHRYSLITKALFVVTSMSEKTFSLIILMKSIVGFKVYLQSPLTEAAFLFSILTTNMFDVCV